MGTGISMYISRPMYTLVETMQMISFFLRLQYYYEVVTAPPENSFETYIPVVFGQVKL